MTSFHFLGLENFIFCETDHNDQPAKFQVPQLSESILQRLVSQKQLLRYHDVSSQYLVFKIARFVELKVYTKQIFIFSYESA